MDNMLLYTIGGLASILGAFKAIDWLISQKYKTKDDCATCRKEIFDIVNKDRDLLSRVDAKMDLVLEHMKITVGGG